MTTATEGSAGEARPGDGNQKDLNGEKEAAPKPLAESARPEVSAMAIAKMMGLATSLELKIVEGKLDLISSKFNTITARLERMLTILNAAPTGSDLERIDVQIGALRNAMQEALNIDPSKLEDAEGSEPKKKA